MQFGLSEEQILLQDNVNRFLDDNTPLDRVRTYAEGGEDADIWAGLTELGVPALLIPEEYGGIGLQPLDAAIVAESLGAHIAPTPIFGLGGHRTYRSNRCSRRPWRFVSRHCGGHSSGRHSLWRSRCGT